MSTFDLYFGEMPYLLSVELMRHCNYQYDGLERKLNFYVWWIFIDLDLDNYPLGTQPFHIHFTGERKHFHLITRHAIDTTDFTKNVIEPFDKASWIGVGISLTGLTLVSFLTMVIYKNVCPHNTIPNLTKTDVFFKIVFGFTEPEKLEISHSRSFTVGKFDILKAKLQ